MEIWIPSYWDENITDAGFKYHNLLTILMFLRVYLVARSLVMHHRITNDSLSQILGKLNEVEINFRYTFKALLQERPWTLLICMIAMVFAIASWCMRICETSYEANSVLSNMYNSFWLVVITYLTIGYMVIPLILTISEGEIL